MNARQELLNQIQMVSFALVDLNLYLDTHPQDRDALDYYHQNRMLMDQLMETYTTNYGPLTTADVTAKNLWTWIEQPWPWELEA